MIAWIKKVIKSRLIQKNQLPHWYKERLAICNGCPFHFYNKKEKTFKDYKWYFLNGFTPQCTICNCGVKFKAALAEEYCAKENIGEQPLWDIEEQE